MTMKSIAILRGGVNATFIESKKPTVTGGATPQRPRSGAGLRSSKRAPNLRALAQVVDIVK
jgi:hypothetical protein